MDRRSLLAAAEDILSGSPPDQGKYEEMADIPDKDAHLLFPGADLIRESHFGRSVHLCTICNGKSGRCSENCSFCAQSAHARTDARIYPLMEMEEMQKRGIEASKTPIHRYSIVTSGRGLPSKEVERVAGALGPLVHEGIDTCASLGILKESDLDILKRAGVTRYHHNLETSKSHFDGVCTTHTYEERVETIRAAKNAGLSLCAGGIFGIGETDRQVLELALTLKALDVDSVPVNFLVPVKGTSAEGMRYLTPLRCLKIISLFRYVLPDKEIIVCGGRKTGLKDLHPLVFYAGASGIMTGDYLTTSGRALEEDLEMLEQIGFVPREKGKQAKNI